VTFEKPTKNYLIFLSFFAYYFLNVGTLTSFFKAKNNKEATKQYKSRFFLLLLLQDGRIRIRMNNDESGSSKHIWIVRIRIHNTASNSRGSNVADPDAGAKMLVKTKIK
jgi:hypothetical protein